MKFPKLHLVCSDDDLRPAMQCIQVGKEFTFASDAHILVRHKTSEIFKDEFVQTLPENPILIPRKAIYLVCQKATIKVSLSDDKTSFQIHRTDGSLISYKLVNESYPNANSIIPDRKNCKPLKEIGINASLLERLTEGMGCNIPIVHMYFFDIHQAIYVTSEYTDYQSATGIIMPTNINIT